MNRADTLLLYGATDTGKTVQLGELAKWEFERTGRISRLISADSGWDPLEDPRRNLIWSPENTSGIIEAWNIQSLLNPWVVLIEFAEGLWPQAQGIGKVTKMMRPVMKDGWITGISGRPVGQYLIEGLNTICTVGMQDHIREARKLSEETVGTFISVGEEIDAGGKGVARSLTLAAPARSHYGQIQRFLLDDLVPKFGRLPVDRVVWTAHEAIGADDIAGKDVKALGPATVGTAVVDKTTLKFGHSFHLTVATQMAKDAKGAQIVSRDFRAYFVSHPDDFMSKKNWPCKVSVSIDQSKELLKRFPGGYIPLGPHSIVEFMEFLETGRAGDGTGTGMGGGGKPTPTPPAPVVVSVKV